MEDKKYTIDNYYDDEDRFDEDLEEFDEAIDKIEGEEGIKDVSSSEELQYVCDIMHGYPFVIDFDDYEDDEYTEEDRFDDGDHADARDEWCSFVTTPENIKKHILEDMANVNIFKGEITPEGFDSEVKKHLEELDSKFCEEDITRMESSASENNFDNIKGLVHEFFSPELMPWEVGSCGGIITGENRYIYCFFNACDGFFFGKEFVVDDEGNIHEVTKNWMLLDWTKCWGKSDFWEFYFEVDRHERADSHSAYIPGLIALYSMAKYVAKIRKENVDKAA